MNLGLFSCLLMMKRNNEYYEDIEDLSGLSKNHPLLSLSFLVILFSLAGIPPLAGFCSKFYLFFAAMSSSLYSLAILGVLTSVVSCFYYIRLIKIMYFESRRWSASTGRTTRWSLASQPLLFEDPLLAVCSLFHFLSTTFPTGSEREERFWEIPFGRAGSRCSRR